MENIHFIIGYGKQLNKIIMIPGLVLVLTRGTAKDKNKLNHITDLRNSI